LHQNLTISFQAMCNFRSKVNVSNTPQHKLYQFLVSNFSSYYADVETHIDGHYNFRKPSRAAGTRKDTRWRHSDFGCM